MNLQLVQSLLPLTRVHQIKMPHTRLDRRPYPVITGPAPAESGAVSPSFDSLPCYSSALS